MARILVLSDLHLVRDPAGRVRGVASRPALAEAIAHARQTGAFDRVVLTGDLAHDHHHETYAALRDALGEWAERALPLVGNHDRIDGLRASFPHLEGGDGEHVNFCVDAGGWRLIGVDTHVRGRTHGRVGAEQLAWLERALSSDERPAVIFMHHPPVRIGTTWLDWVRLKDADAFAGVLARSRSVRAIFHGHAHMASEGALGGVPVIGTPATVFQFIPGSWWPRRGPAVPGYRTIDLGDDMRTTAAYPRGTILR